MSFRFQLRRKDKRYHVVVSKEFHEMIYYYAKKKGTTMTDAVHKLLLIAIQHEFPRAGQPKTVKEHVFDELGIPEEK